MDHHIKVVLAELLKIVFYCRTIGRHPMFRWDTTNVDRRKPSAGRALEKKDTGFRVLRKAQEEVTSLTRRAALIGGS